MQTENIAIKESENGKVIACDHELFVKKIATNFSEKYFLLRFKLSYPKLFSFSLKNPEGCRVKEIIGIITLLYEVDPADKRPNLYSFK